MREIMREFFHPPLRQVLTMSIGFGWIFVFVTLVLLFG